MMLWLPILALVSAHGTPLPACPSGPPDPLEDPALYLITAAPGHEPFSFLGHSSLWLRDGALGIDRVWEFGVIDSRRQEPLSSLLLGSLECRWQVEPPAREARSYRRTDRPAVARRIHLPPDAQARVVAGLLGIRADLDAYSLFHWRDRSCATAVRDLLDEGLDGALQQKLAAPWPHSPRDEVQRHLDRVPWAGLALDLLAGPSVDQPMTQYDAGFLPDLLDRTLSGVRVEDGRGGQVALLGEACQLSEGALSWAPATRPDPRPRALGLGLLGGALLLVPGRFGGRPGRIFAALALAVLGLLLGLLGTVGLLLWGLSALEEFRANPGLLLANPLHLGLLPLAWAWARGRRPAWARPFTGLLALFGLLALLPLGGPANLARVGLLWPPLLAAFALAALPPRSPP